MMNNRMMQSLDNWTANQYSDSRTEPRAVIAGRIARRYGKSITSYRCQAPSNVNLWQRGWLEEDSEMESEYQADKWEPTNVY